jgi:formate-dependent nitrite reductase membrane component NrfD
MNRVEVIHKHVAPNKTATDFTLLVVGTIALMLLRVHNRIERAALTRRETVVAFFGKVLGNLVLITHKCTPLVLVGARVVGFLVQRHEKIILLIRLLGVTYRLRITDRRTN